MNPNIKSLLLPFHFGSIEDKDRTLVERELLTDSEVLVDYLDLKRNLESAELIPHSPSRSVWIKLQERVKAKKKFIIPISFGAAVAASVVAAFIFYHQPSQDTKSQTQSGEELLFDTRTELPANSSVL
ncbi:MAG: hypothetical protein A2Z20_04800 [Bdellovibrionales bacterium RBG_16_40_8]|nr:MAG: hypothetical protein A2Z20_04800 [Bdellovibrionales bacterium RBG_16_40_8]